MTLTRRTVLQSSTAVAAAALAGVGAGTAELNTYTNKEA